MGKTRSSLRFSAAKDRIRTLPSYFAALPDRVWAAILFMISIGLTAATWSRTKWWTGDSFQYLRLAQNLFSGVGHVAMGGNPEFFFPPGYSTAIGLLDLALSSPIVSGRLVSALGSASAVAACFMVFRRWMGKAKALLGAGILLLMPLRIWSSSWVMSEGIFMGCIWSGLLAAVSQRVEVSMLSGAAIGMAYLTRPEGLAYLPAVLALQIIARGSTIRQAIFRSLAICGIFLVVTLPYLSFVRSNTGEWSLSGKLEYNLAWAQATEQGLPVSSILKFDASGFEVGTDILPPSPSQFLRRSAANIVQAVRRLSYQTGPSALTATFVVMGLLGILAEDSKAPKPGRAFLEQCMTFAPLPVLLPFFISDRFLLVMAPVVCLWLASGITEMAHWGAYRFHRPPVKWLLTGTLVVICAGTLTARLTHPQPHKLSEEQSAAQALRDDASKHNLAQIRVMAAEPTVPYFADGDWVAPPPFDLEGTLRSARRRGVTHLVVTAGDSWWPAAGELLAGADPPPNLLPIAAGVPEGTICAYRIAETSPALDSSH